MCWYSSAHATEARMRPLPLLVLIAACSASPAPAPDGTESTTPTASTVEDTGFRPADQGSLMLVRTLGARPEGTQTKLYGLFVDTHPGYVNLAECAIRGGPCLNLLPTVEDDFINIDLEREFNPLGSDYRFAGVSVSMGPYQAFYVGGPMSFYWANLKPELDGDEISGDFGVKFSGEWGEYDGFENIEVSENIELLRPAIGSTTSYHDGESLIVEWVPNGTGEIYLTVLDGDTLARLYLLEDDGYFELPMADLGLSLDSAALTYRLSRWNHGQAKKAGNHLDVLATSTANFSSVYFYTEGRDRLDTSDTCIGATALTPITTGTYWGRLQDWGYTDRMNVTDDGNNCTGRDTDGQEGFVRVDLPPRGTLNVEYWLLDQDASLYVLRDCNDGNTCAEGSDDSDVVGALEHLRYFNDTELDETVYLVLDAERDSNGLYYANITVDTMDEPEMYDTCALATGQTAPLVSGTYFTDFTSYTNQLDPGNNGCAGSASPGTESMSKVVVPSGQTLTVNIDMPGGDPTLYALYACTSPSSCAVGADNSVGSTEGMVYENISSASETLYLVVDSKTTLEPYFLTVDIN